jgi:hypothetical protein
MFLHTFYTWLLSNLLHPVLFVILSIITQNYPGIFNPHFFIDAVTFFAWSLVISLPCLLLGVLCLYLIINSPYSAGTKFMLWLATGPSLVFLEFLFILLVMNLVEIEILLFSFPGIAAVGISILIRYWQFEKLSYSPKIDNHETNLV